MKKLMALLLSVVMVLSLAACGGGDKGGSGSGEKKGDGKLTVNIWDNGQQKGLQEICDLYTKETGVKVDVQVITWDQYWTLLSAGAQGGEMPDVFWMHSNEVQKYMENGILLDLTDKIAKSEKVDLSKYPAELVEMYKSEGKNYAVPKDIDTIALWYNKKIFDECGIKYPDDTWTWDTYYDVAKEITEKGKGKFFGTDMASTNNQDGYYNMIYSMGGYVINDDKTKSGYDDPNTVKAMEYLGKLIKDCMPEANIISETGTDALFTSGKVAMITQGSWMVAAFRDNEYSAENADIAVLPKDAATGKRTTIYNGLGWAASAKTDMPEEAWGLIEWLGSEDMQKKQAELGVTMSAWEGTSDAWVKSVENFNLQAHLDMMNPDVAEMIIRPYSRSTIAWEDYARGDGFRPAWADPAKMADQCKAVAEQMNAALAEEKQ
ncbi:MAG: sugar ABC transporter substrate-binding protein [Lachnospiraceae bacterium]|nr:sugar ABC transporter substrate-binding protein [Lachnospiraceae bacterium]